MSDDMKHVLAQMERRLAIASQALAKIAGHDFGGCKHEKQAMCIGEVQEDAKRALDDMQYATEDDKHGKLVYLAPCPECEKRRGLSGLERGPRENALSGLVYSSWNEGLHWSSCPACANYEDLVKTAEYRRVGRVVYEIRHMLSTVRSTCDKVDEALDESKGKGGQG